MKIPVFRTLSALLLGASLPTVFAVSNLRVTNDDGPPISTNVDPDTAVLRWTGTGNDENTFRVCLSTGAVGKQHTILRTWNEFCELGNLKENTTYNIRIYSYKGTLQRDSEDPARHDPVLDDETASFTTGPFNPLKAVKGYPSGETLTTTSGVTNNVLTWSAAPDPSVVSYNVYFGTDMTPDETELRGNVKGTSFKTGKLLPNTHYWWRVDSVRNPDADQVVEGRLWDFWTDDDGEATYSQIFRTLFVDHFESGITNGNPEDTLPDWTRQNIYAQLRNTGYQGGKCVKLARSTWIQKDLNTKGMASIKVSYRRVLSGNQQLVAEYSKDAGANWTQLNLTGTGAYEDGQMTYSCGSDAANKPSLLVRFRTTSAGTSDYAYLDMVEITGVPKHYPQQRSPIGENIANEDVNVMFLGDSLTSNVGGLNMEDDEYLHWTDVVQQRLGFNMLHPDPADSGESRQTTYGKGGSKAFMGSSPIPTSTDPFARYGTDDAHPKLGGFQRLRFAYDDGAEPDFVVINFGMNDHKREWDSNGNAAEVRRVNDFAKHIERIVAMVRDNGGVPVLVVPHDIYEGSWTNLDSYYGKIDPELFADDPGQSALGRYRLFMEAIRDFKDGYGSQAAVDVIDLNAASQEYDADEMTVDGVHCARVGHGLYARIIGDFLAERFATPAP